MTSPSTDRRYGVNPGLGIKAPCRVATTANITLNGTQTIDGIAVVADDRVLVKNQTDASENGVYVCDTGDWSRDVDFNGNRDVVKGTIITVNTGTINTNTLWRITTANPIVIGTSDIDFTPNTTSATDSSAISFTPDGNDAVITTVQTKLRERISVLDFGADPTGLVDCTTEIQNAIDYIFALGTIGGSGWGALDNIGGELYFPTGTYLVGNLIVPYGPDSQNCNFSMVGNGFGTTLIKNVTGVTAVDRLAVITLQGDVAVAAPYRRVMNIRIEDMTIDGAGVAEMGIFGCKLWRAYFNRLRLVDCDNGLRLVGSSEVYVKDCQSFGTGVGAGIDIDGNRYPIIYGAPMAVSSATGNCEDINVENCYFDYNNWAVRINLAASITIHKCLCAGNSSNPNAAKSNILILSAGTDAGTQVYNIVISQCWFEFDPSSGYPYIDIASQDGSGSPLSWIMRKIVIRECVFVGATSASVICVRSGMLGSNTNEIYGLTLVDNQLTYSATNQFPAFLQEYSPYCKGTTVKNCWPVGAYGGSRTANDIIYPEFNELVYQPTIWRDTADGASWCNSLDGWVCAGAGAAAVRKTGVADTWNGFAGPQLGDGSNTDAIQFYRNIDISQYRNKMILVTFMLWANVTDSDCVGIYVNTGTSNLANPNSTYGDSYSSRLDIAGQPSAAEVLNPGWRRMNYFIPICTASPASGDSFGAALAAYFNLIFYRPAALGTNYVRIADLKIWAANINYNRSDAQ